jgi:hypothetical protein
VELTFPLDFPEGLLGDNRASIAETYSPPLIDWRYARHIDLRAKSVARAGVQKKRDFILGYTRALTPVLLINSPRQSIQYRTGDSEIGLAGGLDENREGEVLQMYKIDTKNDRTERSAAGGSSSKKTARWNLAQNIELKIKAYRSSVRISFAKTYPFPKRTSGGKPVQGHGSVALTSPAQGEFASKKCSNTV